MHRPGVDYWASTHSSTQPPPPPRRSVSSSSGPPSLSHTSTADFFVPSSDAPSVRTTASLDHRGPLGSPSSSHRDSSSSSSAAVVVALQREITARVTELSDTKQQLTQLQQQQRQEEERVRRLQAAWTREGVEYANSLKTLQASLDREHELRTTAEQERHDAVREGHQLRAALRAMLTQPLSSSHGGHSGIVNDAVPRILYDEARRLLLHCERIFAALKKLQLRATDAAGLERLRCYDVPVLDDIPPTWPPETPQKNATNSRTTGEGSDCGEAAPLTPTVVRTTTAAATTGVGAPSPCEETPTGPEVSALTTVSPDTPCTPPGGDPSASTSHPSLFPAPPPLRFHLDTSASKEASDHLAVPSIAAEVSSLAAAGGPRRVLLSPPVLSPSADVGEEQKQEQQQVKEEEPANAAEQRTEPKTEAGWSGPMHEHASDDLDTKANATTATTTTTRTGSTHAPTATTPLNTTATVAVAVPSQPHLHPLPGAPLSEFEREDIIRGTDKLIRQLARETVALAKREGARGSTDVAALCHSRGLDYVDPAFLPVMKTLGLAGGGCRGYDPEHGSAFLVQWCNRDVFAPHGGQAALLTSTGVDPNALRCGRLGDTGVVAALAALAEAAGAVTSVLASTTSKDEEYGLYVVWLCVRGWWTRVTLDAYLPCVCASDETVTLYGCRNTASGDLWAAVCEKALAKTYGTYQALPHLRTETVLGYLTGGPVECWDWWHRSSDTALDEIEAAINTNARGAGMVLLTTHPAVVIAGTTAAQRSACHDNSNAATTAAVMRVAYEELGLLPGTAYRVLAVTENADGEAMVLLRNWAKSSSALKQNGSTTLAKARGDRRDVSPLRDDDEEETADALNGPIRGFMHGRKEVAVAQYNGSGGDDGCVWLRYTTQVLPLFDKCHACFDCRRFHDVRFPISFAGSAPAVPAQLIRVRVRDRRGRRTRSELRRPTRLWIGLHSPCDDDGTSGAIVPWALKVTLIGQEAAPPSVYRGWGGGGGGGTGAAPPPGPTRPARRSYVLSESFMGEPQVLPAVWMYLELDPDDLTANVREGNSNNNNDDDAEDGDDATAMEFFVVPHMELVDTIAKDSFAYAGVGGDAERFRGNSGGRSKTTARKQSNDHSDDDDADEGSLFEHKTTASVWLPRGTDPSASSPGLHTTAIVAVLAEHRESVAVDVVVAPEELRAAVYHDVVDRIDFSECYPISGRVSRRRGTASSPPPPHDAVATGVSVADVRCQLNGRCLSTFSW